MRVDGTTSEPEERDPAEPDEPAALDEAPSDAAVVDDPDSLDGVETSMSRLLRRSRGLLALVVAAALVIPSGSWLLEELGFRSSGDAVVAALGDDAALADALLLVRATSCTGGVSTGSAFVVDLGDGPVVVTNRHVVAEAAQVGLRRLDGGAALNVVAVRLSATADVAVLELGDRSQLDATLVAGPEAGVGDPVRLVGFPAGQPFTTDGTVASVDPAQLLVDLRTDPGASGSPLVDADGRVVGQIRARTVDGGGVATPIGALRQAVRDAEPAPGC